MDLTPERTPKRNCICGPTVVFLDRDALVADRLPPTHES
tara:strand:+ start:316 stop:432 length:117 start_codon:yes stop_codon:yes gene_type:complete